MSNAELDQIRQQRIRQLMQQYQQQELQQRIQEQEINSQINAIIQRILAPDACSRLENLRIAMPDFAKQVEILLIQLYQAGRLTKVLTDKDFKEILRQIDSKRRERKIKL